jgi:hypothetical protein
VRTRIVAALAALLLAGPVAPATHADDDWTFSTTYIASGDGTPLHAQVYRPARGGRVPVVLLVSPYLNGISPAHSPRGPGIPEYEEMEELLYRGYAVVEVSLRGYNASGGCGDLGGPGEQMDAKAAVEWSAAQPWSTGRVGMWGISYDGWTQIMALATRPKGLAALVVQAPITRGYSGFWMNGAHYEGGWLATSSLYAQMDLMPPHQSTGPDGIVTAVSGTASAPHCYATNVGMTKVGDPTTAYWKERDLVARAATSTVPVLYSQGFLDFQVKPDNMSQLYPLLRGPKRMWTGQFIHRAPIDPDYEEVRERYVAEAYAWLDAYVKRDAKALRAVQRQPGAVVQQGDGRWRTDDRWPPSDARPALLTLREGSYVAYPSADGSQLRERGGSAWSFSQALPYAVHLSGVPRVTVDAKGVGPAQVAVRLWDVDAGGNAVLVTKGVHAGVSGKVAFDLYPQDWRFERGHRVGVEVLANDDFWVPSASGGQVTVSAGSVSIPALRRDRRAFLVGEVRAPAAAFALSAETISANQTTFRLPPRMR